MSRLARVLWRELRAQVPLAGVAVVAALLPWLAPALPGLAGSSATEVRHAGAALVAGLLAVAVGSATGAGLLARELAEGRLPFYLALPVRAWELWLGKVLAASLLVYGAVALALAGLGGTALEGLREAVVSLQVDSPVHEEVAVTALLVLLAAAPLLVILLTHHLAVAVRSRSPWLLVDLAAVGLAMGLGSWSLEELRQSLAYTELAWGAIAACAALLLAFGVGGWAGLSRGGVLPARFHRTAAFAVAVCLLAAASGLAAWVSWALRPGVGAVRAVDQVVAAPAGGWALSLTQVAGRPSFAPWILVAPDGAALRLSPGLTRFALRPPADFSADGRALVWRRPLRGALGLEHELVWVALDGGTPRPEPTGIVVHGAPLVALTSDGLLAVRERSELRVWGSRGRQPLAVAGVDEPGSGSDESLAFAGDTVRLTSLVREGPRAFLQVGSLGPGERTMARGRPAALGEPGDPTVFVESFERSPDGERLAVVQGYGGSGAVSLHDAATGVLLARLCEADGTALRNVRFLADGRVAVPARRGDELFVLVYSRDGSLLSERSLGTGLLGAQLAGESRPGKLLASAAVAWRIYEAHRQLRELDLETGRWRALHTHLVPAASGSARPGDRAVRLFHHQRDRTLVELDPESGALRLILPRPRGDASP